MINIIMSNNEIEIKKYELFASKNKKRITELVVTNKRLIFNSFNKKNNVKGILSIPVESINGPICFNVVKEFSIWLIILIVLLFVLFWTIPLAFLLLKLIKPRGVIIISHNLSNYTHISNTMLKYNPSQYLVRRVLTGKDYELVMSELPGLIEDIKNNIYNLK